jgi:hypothetical protein
MAEKMDGLNNDMPMPPTAPEAWMGERHAEDRFDKLSGIVMQRLSIFEEKMRIAGEQAGLIVVDTNTTRTRVTNLLQRMEPRLALIERVLLDAGILEYNDKGQIVTTPPKDKEKSRKKRRYKRNVTAKVMQKKRK